MIFLIGSILFSAYLTLAFKLCERFNINLFQAIVINYLVCVGTGIALDGEMPFTKANLQSPWIGYAIAMGGLFIVLFNIIGFTAQRIGVAVASVGNKLSLIIPFLFSIILYQEQVTVLKMAGVLIALAAVWFTCLPAQKEATPDKRSSRKLLWLPAVLFIGSGLLDTLIKYAEHHFLNEGNKNAFIITGFATAFLIGVVVLAFQLVAGKARFKGNVILAGIAIGVPNYFSMWFLVKVLKEYSTNSTAIIPINNMGIVLVSTVAAGFLFKEKLSLLNRVGILLAITAIALIAFG
jgi:drug/metabolite transporter (DMT)-like permease